MESSPEEIKEGNEIIQRWMGWQLDCINPEEPNNPCYLFQRYENGEIVEMDSGGEDFNWNKGDYISYHKDWNRLIHVIDKIEAIGEDETHSDNDYHFIIQKRYVRVIFDWNTWHTNPVTDMKAHSDSFQDYRHALFSGKREAVWFAVVEFIKWYTEKNKNG